MPIQWSGVVNSPYKLAQIIQGEAASPEGQFAVASVMWNRLQSGKFGSDIASVVTPTQFNGFNSTPSANALSLAEGLWNGSGPPGGDTGNALYFAAPSYADASSGSTRGFIASITGGGTNIGGNFFSDQFGAPSGNFVPPSYTGGPGTSTTWGLDGQQPGGAGGAQSSYNGDPYANSGLGNFGNDYRPGSAFGLDGPNAAAAGGDPNGGIGNIGGMVGQPGPDGSGNQVGLAALFGQNTSPKAVNDKLSANLPQGIPSWITNASTVGQQAGQAINKGLVDNATALRNVGQAGIQAGSSWLQTGQKTATDVLVRGGLILLALVILGGAWMFYSADKGAGHAVAA